MTTSRALVHARYLTSSFWPLFGAIWALVGTTFGVAGVAMFLSGTKLESSDGSVAPTWVGLAAFGGLGLVFAVPGWIMVLRGVRKTRAAIALLETGFVGRGRVVEVETVWNVRINRRHPRRLRYRFLGPDGREREGTSEFLPCQKEGSFAAGQEIEVVYDPRDPERHAMDLFGVRTAGGGNRPLGPS